MKQFWLILLTFSSLLFVASCESKSPTIPAIPIANSQDVIHPKIIEGRYNVGILILEGVFNTELTAPYDIFHHTIFRDSIKPMNVFTVAEKAGPVKTFEGMYILPDFIISDTSLPQIDILVVPSAENNMGSDLENETVIDFVRQTAKTALYVTSHCDGAFVLAKAGLLDGRACTTFPADRAAFAEMFPKLDVKFDAIFVQDGKYITSVGGARSFDAALYLTELMYGKQVADEIAEGLVLDWDLAKVPHLIMNENQGELPH